MTRFAQLYRRLGAAVTVIDPGPHLLGHEDVDVSEAIEGVFRDESFAEGVQAVVMALPRYVPSRGAWSATWRWRLQPGSTSAFRSS